MSFLLQVPMRPHTMRLTINIPITDNTETAIPASQSTEAVLSETLLHKVLSSRSSRKTPALALTNPEQPGLLGDLATNACLLRNDGTGKALRACETRRQGEERAAGVSAHVLAAGDAPCSVREESTKKGERERAQAAAAPLRSSVPMALDVGKSLSEASLSQKAKCYGRAACGGDSHPHLSHRFFSSDEQQHSAEKYELGAALLLQRGRERAPRPKPSPWFQRCCRGAGSCWGWSSSSNGVPGAAE
ncbi:hypothetical protein Anapl_07702 [Anas platyrhynchos]|uniref:Uncharacterized protein n=1 Tax=Anas platyrhynchos TaxID=8839 RepID=R0L9L0_ANAPL|nr:hypothetical protein Anapl_07702 [Anas platyrhynchos]